MLGILALDTSFPRIRGDVGCPATFDFPVKYATVQGADPEHVVHLGSDAALPHFVRAAESLIEEGCVGIATTCGFLARWQRELAHELSVPVLTSSLFLVPLVARMLPAHRKVGVVTYSAAALTPPVCEICCNTGTSELICVDGHLVTSTTGFAAGATAEASWRCSARP